ncbi:hypothetical protein L9F63_017979, partial [Diploptera punctata]
FWNPKADALEINVDVHLRAKLHCFGGRILWTPCITPIRDRTRSPGPEDPGQLKAKLHNLLKSLNW